MCICRCQLEEWLLVASSWDSPFTYGSATPRSDIIDRLCLLSAFGCSFLVSGKCSMFDLHKFMFCSESCKCTSFVLLPQTLQPERMSDALNTFICMLALVSLLVSILFTISLIPLHIFFLN